MLQESESNGVLNLDHFQASYYREVIEHCVVECTRHFGERLVAMYVWGSVHRNEAIAGLSDMELTILTTDGFTDEDNHWQRQMNERDARRWPNPGTGWLTPARAVDTVISRDPGFPCPADREKIEEALRETFQGRKPAHEAGRLMLQRAFAFIFQYDSTLVWGENRLEGREIGLPDRLWIRASFQSPWDNVRHAAGLSPACATPYARENIEEWKLPTDPALRLRKLARLGLMGGAYLLIHNREFGSFRGAVVLPALRRSCSDWSAFLDETEDLYLTPRPDAAERLPGYLSRLAPWMDWLGEQLQA